MTYLDPAISDAVTFTLLSLIVITTFLRLYCRKFIVGVLGLDDYLIILALCCGIANAPLHHIKITTFAELYYSIGPNAKIDPTIFFSPKFVKLAPISFAAGFLYNTELALIKLAIVAFYCRITPNKAHRYVLYFVAFLIFGFCVANHLALFFQFDPIAASWDRTIKGAVTRYKPEDLTVANGGFQISSDAILLLLPIPILRSLQCSRRTKGESLRITRPTMRKLTSPPSLVGLYFLFGLGIFAMAASAMRLYRSVVLQKATGIDGLVAAPVLQVWTDFETSTALICANLPALASFFQYVRKQRKLKSASSNPPVDSDSYGVSKESKPLTTSTNGNTTRGSDENVMTEKSSGITRMTEFSMDVEANGAQHQHGAQYQHNGITPYAA
ncbi:MAG: hypothetical protein M1829_003856 [Trizodia sp. TS-e1964]|nr:MAG: hypothetical protein M1829_003856 [Trizodia sp. TS-e1964]